MKITKRQLRRIIREEKARRIVRRRLMEQPGGHTVTGNHEGQEFSVQVPDDLARSLLEPHAALVAKSPEGDPSDFADSRYYDMPEVQAFSDAAQQVNDFVDEQVAQQTGAPVHPTFGINGEFYVDGSQMSDALGDAGNFL